MTQTGKQPIRTCVACGGRSDKRTLIRFVRTPDACVMLDGSGKMKGRGAYLCADGSCFEKARKRHSLDRALKVSLGEEEYERLENDFKQMCEECDDAR